MELYHRARSCALQVLGLPGKLLMSEEEIRRRLNLLVLTGGAILVIALAAVVLSASVLTADRSEVKALTATNFELTKRANRLRAEAALARSQVSALKGVMRSRGLLNEFVAIQGAVDGYAREGLGNGAADTKTQEDVRREVCDKLAAVSPCDH